MDNSIFQKAQAIDHVALIRSQSITRHPFGFTDDALDNPFLIDNDYNAWAAPVEAPPLVVGGAQAAAVGGLGTFVSESVGNPSVSATVGGTTAAPRRRSK